jgi:hypothetical protein
MSNVVKLHLKCATGILVQIEALKAAGVDEVVLAINYQPEVLFYIGITFLFHSILSVLMKNAR